MKYLDCTCIACPHQFEGIINNNYVYVRYRGGILKVEVYPTEKDFDKELNCIYRNRWQVGKCLQGEFENPEEIIDKIEDHIINNKLEELIFEEIEDPRYSDEECEEMIVGCERYMNDKSEEKLEQNRKYIREYFGKVSEI